MKKFIAALAAAAVMAIAPASAFAGKSDAPGYKIKSACDTSFGALVSAPKKAGEASTHGNYAGGAKAFSADAILAAHGCNVNGD